MKLSRNILLLFLLCAFGLTVFQYVPVLKKAGIRSELIKKELTDTEESDAEEKDSDDEKKDQNNFTAGPADLQIKYLLTHLSATTLAEGNYFSILQQKTTPPPEQA